MPINLANSEEDSKMKDVFIPYYATKRSARSPTPSAAIDVSQSPFDKVQLTKLLIDALDEMGYHESAVSLQKESGGIEVESSSVQKLFSSIKYGQFEKIDLYMLSSLPLKNGVPMGVLSQTLSASSATEEIASNEGTAVDDDAMKIDNIISKKTDWNKFFVNMQSEFKLLEPLIQNMNDYDSKTIQGLSDMMEILILINKQVFIELMFDQQESSLAVLFLRTVFRKYIQLWELLLMYQESTDALTPDTLLKQMTSILTCPPNSAEYSHIWPGTIQKSRKLLIDAISKYIDPNDLVPRGRLFTLLRQAIKYQNSQDILNFDEGNENQYGLSNGRNYNLLQDNVSNSHRIGFRAERTLGQNVDEIWYLEFSPDGKYLASASADSLTDRKVLIYDVENNFQVYKVLGGNDQCVLYLSFSPDSRYLVSCPFNEEAKIYDIHKSGEPTKINPEIEGGIVAEIIQPEDSFKIPDNKFSSSGGPPRIWCCNWFHTDANRGRFVLGSPDRDVIIYDLFSKSVIFKLSEAVSSGGSSSQDQFPRVHDLKITRDDKYLLLMAHEYFVDTYDLSQLPPVDKEDESGDHIMDPTTFHIPKVSRLNVGKRMTCLTIPRSRQAGDNTNSLILLNVQPHELQLWDFKEQILVQKYFGQRQLQFIIRSCFGYDNKLVASGSEDGKIYIWDRFHGNIISVLNGHTADRTVPPGSTKTFGRNCNIVVWNPVDKTLFASGGDDGLIKIWRVTRD
ncbi:LAFE_0G01068g1_1 [Lachancea fermentati]|uniref:LAFE_0G01068g1_1 n=1 Tax=Lachancea fermentati TaxID=4955 RepID=A0A1G4MGI1_LACFM|nr:LAFE_0G01068g1_1 [Lachancea fermentati]